MNWMLLPLKRYAEFSGRSRRMEYWMFALLQIIVLFGIVFIGIALTGGESEEPPVFVTVLFGIYFLGIIVPSIAVQVRRFHDQDRSGWFVLLNFIPYLGTFVVLIFMLLPGTQGENRFGPDPKQAPEPA